MIHDQLPNNKPLNPCDLAGRGVLITRPAAQAEGLCRLVAAAGGRAIRFPTVAIEPVANREPARELLAREWDLILFVSRNAVEQALSLFPNRRLPAEPQLGAVGAATAQALTLAGRVPDLMPTGRFDSESLLALPALADLEGRRVLIVRGVGGRGLLGDTLIERGARLAYAEVYRRTLPVTDAASLLTRWRRDVQLATATSGEILENLLTLIGGKGRDLLLATPLVVVSERTGKTATALGFTRVEVADGASDTAVLAALCRIIETTPQAGSGKSLTGRG
ncbi:uroporphyrinogen-III synthase [Candidatus Thiosymbion oneisti]|uniref:uroporphyrinogen-III synthase n=1 Tax=Candidatus Thiosymbion oneisti TaxID=589554 RepID=UPI000B288924|nr:uroporphyrinogen-III synthase [Candidatus Thiosymbion oneisti]